MTLNTSVKSVQGNVNDGKGSRTHPMPPDSQSGGVISPEQEPVHMRHAYWNCYVLPTRVDKEAKLVKQKIKSLTTVESAGS